MENITGRRFGNLVVLSFDRRELRKTRGFRYFWNCLCDCKKQKSVNVESLRRGLTKSCGCLEKQNLRRLCDARKTHGMSGINRTPEYTSWAQIKARCLNPKDHAYFRYGGRGITVCERWRDSFENFFLDMGKRPSDKHSIDRIDNNLGYSKDNCRWANDIQQANNTRRSKKYEYSGENMGLSEWARKVGIKRATLHRRLKAGWSVDDALSKQPKSFIK